MALRLKDLFVHPIERYIPPVAKVTDVAEDTVETDLREYVVTAPIERALTRLLDVPGDVLDKLQIIFFSDPINAAFRAMGLD